MMMTTLRTALRHAAEHMRRRHLYDVLHAANDHTLRDIGVTRDDLYQAVMRGQH
jgi:uncharacterized protein YjiS (DUF1127 family)